VFPARSATDKTYACFRAMLPEVGGNPSLVYFAHFKNSATFFESRIYVMPSTPAFTFGLTVQSYTAAPGLPVPWPVTLTYGQWYTIVTSFDAATGTSEMWIDPVNESSPKITHVNALGIGTELTAFALRQSTGNWAINIDDIGVGTTFDEACIGPVPTQISTWGNLKGIYR
jgi:hypothetical protein